MIDHANKLIIKEYLCDDFSMIGNDYTIKDCNLSQLSAHSPVCSGLSGLRFEGDCHLVNCDLPIDSFVSSSCFGFGKHICFVEKKEDDFIDHEITQIVDKISNLSFKYPEKVSAKLKGKVDKDTTEGLLKADGADITINAPNGWKKS